MSEPTTGTHALAHGFAQQLRIWASHASEESQAALILAGQALSSALSSGHVCIPLLKLENPEWSCTRLRAALLASGLVSSACEVSNLPLHLNAHNYLYLQRYINYESRLAHRLIHFWEKTSPTNFESGALLDKLFSGHTKNSTDLDWQKLAAALALYAHLCIISGGPGTGKTTTVVNLLACLLAQNPTCKIVLAAPTGKAATRMLEALRTHAGRLPEALQKGLPHEAFTLHHLLGAGRNGFTHHADNPLQLDVLIVDEASMLDLALATQLFEALPDSARVILLGDQDQLAAVEAGAVFAEISADASWSKSLCEVLFPLARTDLSQINKKSSVRYITPLHDRTVWLRKSFRFSTNSPIGKLASAVRNADTHNALALLEFSSSEELHWYEDGDVNLQDESCAALWAIYEPYLQAVQQKTDINKIFAEFFRVRILCAQRAGARGVNGINQWFEHRCHLQNGGPWYTGRPVMILKNDAALKLFNGDIGLTFPDKSGRLRVYFQDPEGRGYRALSPMRLPAHETAFALTIHKSQGSEFDSVITVLPNYPSALTSRELLYTAITRTKKNLQIIGPKIVLAHAIAQPSQRYSGLVARINELMDSKFEQ